MPVAMTTAGAFRHLDQSKSTDFCLSCHEMQPYFDGFLAEPSARESLSAVHFQNRTIPRDEACYTCHTTYAMFGDIKAKMAGVQHLWVHYFGRIPDELELYQPYSNRECFHCHAEARSNESVSLHQGISEQLASDETSCMQCHRPAHDNPEPAP